MNPEDKAEEHRRAELAQLEKLEQGLKGVISRDHYMVADGEVVTDPATGQPVEDPEPARQAAALLARIAARRAGLLGREQAIIMDEASTIITSLSEELARNDPPANQTRPDR